MKRAPNTWASLSRPNWHKAEMRAAIASSVSMPFGGLSHPKPLQ